MIGFIFVLVIGVLFVLSYYPRRRSVSDTQRFERRLHQKIDSIDSLLPQTQCGKCDYSGCRPYAEAIARGNADINQCPPGGELTIRAIANLLGRDPVPFPADKKIDSQSFTALIDESLCIGCVKCIPACPVDAIIGSRQMMHTIIKQNCTGCELCIEPCPVDCISMVPVWTRSKEWVWSKPGSILEH